MSYANTSVVDGFLRSARYLIHDRDSVSTADVRGILRATGAVTG